MNYIANAFSLQMLDLNEEVSINIKISPIEEPSLESRQSMQSVVGHADTAAVLKVPFNRVSLALKKGDVLIVAQIVGGRLPEGSINLPEGFKIKWVKVEIA